jgi:hypothetical protein
MVRRSTSAFSAPPRLCEKPLLGDAMFLVGLRDERF